MNLKKWKKKGNAYQGVSSTESLWTGVWEAHSLQLVCHPCLSSTHSEAHSHRLLLPRHWVLVILKPSCCPVAGLWADTSLGYMTILAETQETTFYDLRLNGPLPPFLVAFTRASTPISAWVSSILLTLDHYFFQNVSCSCDSIGFCMSRSEQAVHKG